MRPDLPTGSANGASFNLRCLFLWLIGDLRLRMRDICRQVCRENVDIPRGGLSSGHVHIVVSVPPKPAIYDLMAG